MSIFDPKILEPINDQSPSGKDTQGTELFDQLEEAYEENLDLDEPITRNWNEVLRIGTILLIERTKDLYIFERLMEASIHKNGINGCLDALIACQKFLNSFWDSFYPNQETPDYLMIRANLLRRFDKYCELQLPNVPITKSAQGEYSYSDYLKSGKKFAIPPDASESEIAAIQEKAKKANTIDSLTWQSAIQGTPTSYFEKVLDIINQCTQIRHSLESYLDEHIPKNDFSFFGLRTSLDQIRDLLQRQIPVKPIQQEKSAHSMDFNDPTLPSDQAESPQGQNFSQKEILSNLDNIHIDLSIIDSRSKAFQIIEKLAVFFESWEPHSPVGPTLRRAIHLGKLSLVELLREITEDESTRDTIFKYYSITNGKN